jgi:NAD-dependent dihydropyrimidine dehydrogenase PreA subunit
MKHKYLKNVTTLFIDTDKCNGCGTCIEVCPHGVLSVVNGRAEIIDKDSCMECSGCTTNCPTKAIYVQSGVGCANAILKGKLLVRTPNSEDTDCCC